MGDVVFRRINGRVIPIRKGGTSKTPEKSSNPDVKKIAIGAAVVGAGVATALFAGKFASKMVIASAKFEDISRTAAKGARTIITRARSAAKRAATRNSTPWQPGLDLGDNAASEFVFRPAQKELLKRYKRQAFTAGIKSNTLFQNRQKVRSFGKVAGGALVTGGLNEMYEGATGEKAGLKETSINSVAGGVIGASVGLGYYGGLSGFRNAFKGLIKGSHSFK